MYIYTHIYIYLYIYIYIFINNYIYHITPQCFVTTKVTRPVFCRDCMRRHVIRLLFPRFDEDDQNDTLLQRTRCKVTRITKPPFPERTALEIEEEAFGTNTFCENLGHRCCQEKTYSKTMNLMIQQMRTAMKAIQIDLVSMGSKSQPRIIWLCDLSNNEKKVGLHVFHNPTFSRQKSWKVCKIRGTTSSTSSWKHCSICLGGCLSFLTQCVKNHCKDSSRRKSYLLKWATLKIDHPRFDDRSF